MAVNHCLLERGQGKRKRGKDRMWARGKVNDFTHQALFIWKNSVHVLLVVHTEFCGDIRRFPQLHCALEDRDQALTIIKPYLKKGSLWKVREKQCNILWRVRNTTSGLHPWTNAVYIRWRWPPVCLGLNDSGTICYWRHLSILTHLHLPYPAPHVKLLQP